jgi:Arc/MetJ-type ribon-helix-helix transcriptional regulator
MKREPTKAVSVFVSTAHMRAVERVVQREGLGSTSAFVRRAVARDLGAFTEDAASLRDYDDIEVEVRPGPLARFALLMFPHMENCESDGCERCRAFLVARAPGLVVSTDTFQLADDGLGLVRGRP